MNMIRPSAKQQPAKLPSPPPNITPRYCLGMKGAGRQFISHQIGMYVYIWMYSGGAFWMYPTEIRNPFVYGYMWQNPGWIYTRIPRMTIDSLYP